MNLTTNYLVDGVSQNIIFCAIYQDTLYTVFDFLQNNPNCSDFLLDSDASGKFNKPFLVSTGNSLDFSSVVKVFDNFNCNLESNLIEQICNILKPSIPDITPNFIKMSLDGYKEFKAYLDNKNVRIKLNPSQFKLDNIQLTQELVNKINSSGKLEDLVIEGENSTIFQKTPTDELFIYVPSYEELAMGAGLLPDYKKFMNPYKDIAALQTPQWRGSLTSTITLTDVVGSPDNNGLEIQENEKRYRKALCSLLEIGTKREFPEVDVEKCLHPESGAAICSTIVMNYFKNIAKTAICANWMHTGLFPKNLNIECMEHDSKFDEDLDDEDEDTVRDDNGLRVEGKHEFFPSPVGVQPRDGAVEFENILDNISCKDPYAVIDTIIQLLRWGSRKPTKINLYDNEYIDMQSLIISSNSGNFNATEVYVDEEGNNLSLAGVITLKDYIRDASYKMKNHIRSSSFDLPVGLICCRKFVDSDARQLVLLSFIDIIMAYKNKDTSCRIRGIDVQDDILVFDPHYIDILQDSSSVMTVKEALNVANNSAPGSFVLYQYSGLKDEFMSNSSLTKNESVLYLINKYINSPSLSELVNYKYYSKEDLQNLCTQTNLPPTTFIESNMVNYFLPILTYVNDKRDALIRANEEPSVDKYLLLFQEAILKLGFTGNFTSETANTDINSATDVTKQEKVENKISASNSFVSKTQSSAPEVEENHEVIKPNDPGLCNTNQSDYHILKLYIKENMFNDLLAFYSSVTNKTMKIKNLEDLVVKSENKKDIPCIVIGYAGYRTTPEGKQQFLFIHPDELDTSLPIEGSMYANTIGAVMSTALKNLAKCKPLANKFNSVSSVSYYSTLINKLTSLSFMRY